jgi:hypothetical protein
LEENMSSNSPCAVYNFYNCCDQAAASKSNSFIWLGGQPVGPMGNYAGPLNPDAVGAVGFAAAQMPDSDLKFHLGMTPLHRSAHLNEVSLIRFVGAAPDSGPPYTSTIVFNLVVLDFNGTQIRTISTAPINFLAIPLNTWTPISLSTVPGDLDIPAGQVIAGQLVFGAALAANQQVRRYYQLTGTGTLL